MHFASTITRFRVRTVALALGLALTAAVLAACGGDQQQHDLRGRGRKHVDPVKRTSTSG